MSKDVPTWYKVKTAILILFAIGVIINSIMEMIGIRDSMLRQGVVYYCGISLCLLLIVTIWGSVFGEKVDE